MRNSKRLLSLFLAVVMVLSVFTVMASAYTMGPQVAGDINYKYTVEKVDTVPETEAGSAEYTADNIYAVSVWMQSDKPVMKIIVPFHFNKELFAPIMLFDGDVTYPTGAGFGVDDYYDNMGEGTVYAYSEGDYLNNTGMYKADGSAATTKALAKCIGMGNANSSGRDVTAELVSPTHPLYSKWGAGLPDNVGVMFASVDVTGKAKTAYLNTVSGIVADTGWNKMFTFYFETLPGVSTEDALGAKFGVYTDDCFTVDGVSEENGFGYFVNATSAVVGNPNKNVVANTYVTVLKERTAQIRFDKTEGTYAGTFDIRAIAVIDGASFKDLLGNSIEAQEAAIKRVGFVFAAGSNITEPDMDAVIDLVENGTAVDGYAIKNVEMISTNTAVTGNAGDYAFTCIVDNIPDAQKTNTLIAVAFLAYENANGDMIYMYYPAPQVVDFNTLYTANEASK